MPPLLDTSELMSFMGGVTVRLAERNSSFLALYMIGFTNINGDFTI